MQSIECRLWGKTSQGAEIICYTIRDLSGAEAEILNWGATLKSWRIPVQNGVFRDVVLGCDSIEAYQRQNGYLGATVGRVANRIGGASFSWEGRQYILSKNDGNNCNHGGWEGFNQKIWQGKICGDSLELTYRSPDGEGGFPGNLYVKTVYRMLENHMLAIDYYAETDKATPINLTNHSYFNLDENDTVLGHTLQIDSQEYTPNDAEYLVTGEIFSVDETPYDFRQPTSLGDRISTDSIAAKGGYDCNYVLSHQYTGEMKKAAVLTGKDLRLVCITDQTGLQLYTANFLHNVEGKNGQIYTKHSAVCLEAQGWPDAVHHKCFPTMMLLPNQRYHRTIHYQISKI